MDRRANNVDENQVKISLPIALSFAVGLCLLTSSVIIYYFNGQIALEGRITVVEAATTDITKISGRVDSFDDDLAGIKQALIILLIDRGYDPKKILSQKP